MDRGPSCGALYVLVGRAHRYVPRVPVPRETKPVDKSLKREQNSFTGTRATPRGCF
jgi:hypothetical protein